MEAIKVRLTTGVEVDSGIVRPVYCAIVAMSINEEGVSNLLDLLHWIEAGNYLEADVVRGLTGGYEGRRTEIEADEAEVREIVRAAVWEIEHGKLTEIHIVSPVDIPLQEV